MTAAVEVEAKGACAGASVIVLDVCTGAAGDAWVPIAAMEVELVVLVDVLSSAAAAVVVVDAFGAAAGGITGPAGGGAGWAVVAAACAVVDVEVELDVEVDVEVEVEDVEVEVEVEVELDVVDVDVVPAPPALFALGTAVHLFPPNVVMNCPAGRLALVAIVTNSE